MTNLDKYDILYIIWAFFFQIVLIVHFAIRKPFFESYTVKYGWIVYALAIPAVIISILILRAGKPWYFWIGGFLFAVYAAYGYWVDYVKQYAWRSPLQLEIVIPYVSLYLATVMFYWWPLIRLDRRLWIVYTVLFVIATILNIRSH